MIQTLSVTKAQEKLPELVEKARKKAGDSIITVNGKPTAILVSIEEYESLKETLEIMSDPELMKAIREGEEDVKKGRTITLEEFEKELKEDV
jgi:prevent-host-death family protein